MQKNKGKPTAVSDLNVEYRGNVTSQAIFLITRDGKVVAQFRVPDETLARTMFHSIIRWIPAKSEEK